MHSTSIGIVLAAVPGYSETFFYSKINGLSKRGYKVLLFARGKGSSVLPVRVVQPFRLPHSKLVAFLKAVLVVSYIFLRTPSRVIRLWKLEVQEGTALIGRLKVLFKNAHVLSFNLDWVYIGFAAHALGHECLAKAIGAKLAVSLRGYDISVYPLKFPGCYSKLWRHVDKVHSLSQYLLDKAYNIGLSKSASTAIIPPAINVGEFNTADRAYPCSEVKILTVARLHWIKGLEYALMGISRLIDRGYNIQYTIVGEGSEYEKLLFEINALSLDACVSLVGKKEPSELKLLMQDACIYLQPSLNEGFCNAVIEAQASGLLCVVTKVGGLSENVEEGVNGWLVPARDAQAIADRILKILQMSPAELQKVSKISQNLAASRFGMTAHLDAWESFYQ